MEVSNIAISCNITFVMRGVYVFKTLHRQKVIHIINYTILPAESINFTLTTTNDYCWYYWLMFS
jgi:hypothetical protein